MSKSNSPEYVSKNGSVIRKSHRKESQSPENTDRMDTHHHKHPKKSKKKKKGKKKHKRKKSKSLSSSSSAGSDEESRIEGFEETPYKSQATVDECPAAASSTGSPEDKGEATTLDCCHPEEEIQSTLIDATKSDSITPSG